VATILTGGLARYPMLRRRLVARLATITEAALRDKSAQR
jgi:hypothetical protein